VKRILIVDDKEENLYYLRTVLTGHGCTVESACHGAEALVKARQAPPDLVVSDLLMPVMDGYTLLRHWKSDERLRKIPFIVYTATYTEPEDERLALSLGADAFILKPAEPEDFLSRIREVQAKMEASVPTDPNHPVGDEKELLKLYSETLIRKLEKKTLELEEANSALKKDIAERQAVEAALRGSEARFRRLVDSNAQGVMFWNMQGGITVANDAFLRILGYTREDLEAGRITWEAVTPPEYADLDRRALAEIQAGGVCTPYEKDYLCKDGSRVPVLVGAAIFEDNSEEGFCFVLDLTERKKLEQQFLRAQRMESIGTLAGGIAHDLNNVLSPILMSLEMLKMRFPDPESESLLAILSTSAQRGADMVRQVLSFARGVEGRRMEVQIKHLVQNMEKVVRDTFLKSIQLRTNIPQDLWTVMGDPTQLHQVLMNLCVNARDSMPNGGTLTISAENLNLDAHYAGLNLEARPGPYVFIQVEDSGSGIPPGIVEKIFDPFFTTKEVGKGTGLGLSTSLAIVKSHGGFMRVYSEVGKGTKFQINLPARTGASDGADAEIVTEMPRGNGELILVVDDELSVRQITQRTLETFGYWAIVASDGAEAMAIYAQRGAEIAVVLTDMMMPVMDGPATIQMLRKINPAVRIIAASGLSANSQIGSLGVKHFLPKPYTAETLLKVLQETLASA
jgi:PAS domain S-box-containing protein